MATDIGYQKATGGYRPPENLDFAQWQGSTQAWQNAVQDALKKGWNPSKQEWDQATKFGPMKSYYDEQYNNRAELQSKYQQEQKNAQNAPPAAVAKKEAPPTQAAAAPQPSQAAKAPMTNAPATAAANKLTTLQQAKAKTLAEEAAYKKTLGQAQPAPGEQMNVMRGDYIPPPQANTMISQGPESIGRKTVAPQQTSYYDNQMKAADRISAQQPQQTKAMPASEINKYTERVSDSIIQEAAKRGDWGYVQNAKMINDNLAKQAQSQQPSYFQNQMMAADRVSAQNAATRPVQQVIPPSQAAQQARSGLSVEMNSMPIQQQIAKAQAPNSGIQQRLMAQAQAKVPPTTSGSQQSSMQGLPPQVQALIKQQLAKKQANPATQQKQMTQMQNAGRR